MFVCVLESDVVLEEELGLLRLVDHTLDVLHSIEQLRAALDLLVFLEVVHFGVLGVSVLVNHLQILVFVALLASFS